MTCQLANSITTTLLGLALLATPAASTHAAPLPAATFVERIYYPVAELLGNDANAELVSAIVSEDWRAVDAAASTSGGARPEGYARMALTIGDPGFHRDWLAGADIAIRYYWMLEQTGGDPYVGLVPVNISARGSAQFVGASGSNAGADVRAAAVFSEMGAGQERNWDVSAPKDERGMTVIGVTSFDETYTAMIEPGRNNRVDLLAQASGWVTSYTGSYIGGSFSATAWVDPIIVIDPAFARSGDFQLLFSAGVSSIPLPTGVLLFGSGLAALACSRWRRRQRP